MGTVRGLDVLRHAQASPPSGPASPARQRLRAQALAMARVEGLVDASYSYRIVPLQGPAAPLLRAGGESLEAPRLLPASGQLTALGCAACTLGPGLERRVSELFGERRASLAMALDELGNELLFDTSRAAQDRMFAEASRRGLSMSGELRAGDPGLALAAQGAVLRLADADSIGIRLGGSLLMHPLKSTSMVLGVGVDLPASTWSRCDSCRSSARCAVRARAAAAA
ncbi:MAG: hypothetical protein NDJ19_04105 [Ramlibacter sp.]|nr:hypothetical protein [Ramlibacter sp.]